MQAEALFRVLTAVNLFCSCRNYPVTGGNGASQDWGVGVLIAAFECAGGVQGHQSPQRGASDPAAATPVCLNSSSVSFSVWFQPVAKVGTWPCGL